MGGSHRRGNQVVENRTASRPFDGGARTDPFQLLLAEHSLLRKEIHRARETEEAGRSREGIDHLIVAVRLHMDREDRALFPVCEKLFGGRDGAASVMRKDHSDLAHGLAALDRAIARRPVPDLGARLEAFETSLDRHLAREERVLFPLMAALLSGSDLAGLARRLRDGTR